MNGIYPAQGRVFRPWKNGGGETAEIAVSPAQSGLETFSWRVSTAWVASDGPFSDFTGIDRVLTVIEGGPLKLDIDGQCLLLDETSPPISFPGEARVLAQLQGAALLDFNVMCRRPLRAEVVKGPLSDQHSARLALLLEPVAGLHRLDLVDFNARPDLARLLAGADVISVRFI